MILRNGISTSSFLAAILVSCGSSGAPGDSTSPSWVESADRALRENGAPAQVLVSGRDEIAVPDRLALAARLRAQVPAIDILWVDGDERTVRDLLAEALPAWCVKADGVEPYELDGPLPEGLPQPIVAHFKVTDVDDIAVRTAFEGDWDFVIVTPAGTVTVSGKAIDHSTLRKLLQVVPRELPVRCRVRARDAWRASEWYFAQR